MGTCRSWSCELGILPVSRPESQSVDGSVTNIYPVLASADNKLVRLLVVGVAVLHAGVALAMKILFYSYSVGGLKVGTDPIDSPVDAVEGAQQVARWLMG